MAPKDVESTAPSLELNLTVVDDDALAIEYAARNLGLGRSEESAACGQVSLNALGRGYGVRVAGPYYKDQEEADRASFVIRPKNKMVGGHYATYRGVRSPKAIRRLSMN